MTTRRGYQRTETSQEGGGADNRNQAEIWPNREIDGGGGEETQPNAPEILKQTPAAALPDAALAGDLEPGQRPTPAESAY
jgi:hypothetical protein